MGVKTDVRQMQDEKFDWSITKNMKNYHRTACDISIGSIKYGNDKFGGIGITFRNGIYELFGDYIQFAVYKNRMLFRTADTGAGLKLYAGSGKCQNRYIKFKVDDDTRVIKEKFIGDFELKYDTFYELYYIEVKEN